MSTRYLRSLIEGVLLLALWVGLAAPAQAQFLDLNTGRGTLIGINGYMPSLADCPTLVKSWSDLGLKGARWNQPWQDPALEGRLVQALYGKSMVALLVADYQNVGIENTIPPEWWAGLQREFGDIWNARGAAVSLVKALNLDKGREFLVARCRSLSTRLRWWKACVTLSPGDDCENGTSYIFTIPGDTTKYGGTYLLLNGKTANDARARYERAIGARLPDNWLLELNTGSVNAAEKAAWGGNWLENAHHVYGELNGASGQLEWRDCGVGAPAVVTEFNVNRTAVGATEHGDVLWSGAHALVDGGTRVICFWSMVKDQPYGFLLDDPSDVKTIKAVSWLLR